MPSCAVISASGPHPDSLMWNSPSLVRSSSLDLTLLFISLYDFHSFSVGSFAVDDRKVKIDNDPALLPLCQVAREGGTNSKELAFLWDDDNTDERDLAEVLLASDLRIWITGTDVNPVPEEKRAEAVDLVNKFFLFSPRCKFEDWKALCSKSGLEYALSSP